MASNNNASGGSKQNNISVHTGLFNRENYYVNPVPDSLRASVAVPLDNLSFDDDTDLWTRAYGAVQKREAKLMKSYMKHLNDLQAVGNSITDGDLLDPVYIDSTVNQLMNIRETKKIQVIMPRANIEIQEEIEKLAKSLIWSDEVVRAASKTQPYVALAWSGVSMFLSNCLHHITEWQKADIYNNSKIQLEAIRKQVILQEEILQDMKKGKQDDMEQSLFGNLAEASGNYARNKDINPKRVPGTCEWFLRDERFCNWRDRQAGALLWVSAGPGCGKSVLSRCLIDEGHLTPNSTITIQPPVIRASQRQSIICYFFFKDGNAEQIDGTQALCAILHQLFKHPSTSNLITYALPSHRTYQTTLTHRMDVLWQILLDCAKSSSADIICLLDALDECRGDSAQRLLGMIENSSSQQGELFGSSKLKFLITSRPYDDLKWSFNRLSVATYLHFDGDEKSGQIGEEINLVIDTKVQQFAAPFSDEDRVIISKRLKSMENRTYLWLHLTSNIIETKRSAYSRSADIEELLCELPANVVGAYEKILSRSQHERKVEALLQIVLAAKRPLTLDEANNALALAVEEGGFSEYAALQRKLWPQSTFKTTVQNLCGLFISIHDSKLSFIHQTAREFLVSHEQKGRWKGRLSLSKSHGMLSGACINYLQILDPSCESLRDEYPLFDYAAYNWYLHFRSQDAASTEMLRKPARELCRNSSQARFWAKNRFLLDYQNFRDVWPDLWFATHLRLTAVMYDAIVHEHANVNQRGVFPHDRLIHLVIENGDLEGMEVLLDHGAELGEQDISFLVPHDSKAEAMMTLLLDKRGSEIEITEDTLEVVVTHRKNGAAVLALLLKRRGDDIKITPNLIRRTVLCGSVETMSLLLDERGNEFTITEEVMRAAVYNSRNMLALLLKRRGHEVNITEAVLIEAMSTCYHETLNLLLDHCNGTKITEEMVQAAAGGYEAIMQLLLEKRGHEITVTENIIKAAVANCTEAEEITSLLLDRRGHEITVTEDIVKAAAANEGMFLNGMISLLFDRRGHEITVTEDIVKAAVANKENAQKIISLLLDRRGHEITFTEDIIKAAMANKSQSVEILSLLLNRSGHEITATKDIIKAAVADDWHSKGVVSLLLDA
ncbi:hypothetical protein TrVFT333_007609 [Trichoderma virens FT-333]|nr:hypothetical protein TrVFT333_007609 [Trichoderma virens FT-333]